VTPSNSPLDTRTPAPWFFQSKRNMAPLLGFIPPSFSSQSTAFHSRAPTMGVVCTTAEDYSPEIGLRLTIKVRTISDSDRRFDPPRLRGFSTIRQAVSAL